MYVYYACRIQAWDPKLNVPSEGRRSELFWSFIQKVAHPVSDSTQPCLTSVKLLELAGPLGHSPLHSSVTSRSFRNCELNIRLPRFESKHGQNCFAYTGAMIWNSFPSDCKKANSFQLFKMKLKVMAAKQ